MAKQALLSEKLQEAQNNYSLISENLVDAVWVLDLESLRYLYISPSVQELRGYTAQEIAQRSIKEFLAPESMDLAITSLQEGMAAFKRGDKQKRRMELLMRHKEGHFVWVEITARLFKDADGAVRVLGVSRDIDHRKKLELERDDLINELRRALAEEKRLRKENHVLRGLLPICAQCKKIRDDEGNWIDLETYIEEHSQAEFTHTICPTCKEQLYPELTQK